MAATRALAIRIVVRVSMPRKLQKPPAMSPKFAGSIWP
jgi:hypothetical protein